METTMNQTSRAFSDDSKLKDRLIAALRDREVSRALSKLQARHAELARVSRAARLFDAACAAGQDGIDVLDSLNASIAQVDNLISSARAATRAFDAGLAAEREKAGTVPYRVARAILECPGEIEGLERLIKGFEQAREAYIENLRQKGVDARMLAQLEPVPTPDDLATWKRDVEAKRDRYARLRAYDASGPAYDPALLGDELLSELSH
ncbi:hypothetical protein [Caballeronia sp. RCC_10]|uniref:hypothetical protein n=1 Tax=Caballeronia sp. RCC_10 TaxID=3239227 RepID=UPI0035233775